MQKNLLRVLSGLGVLLAILLFAIYAPLPGLHGAGHIHSKKHQSDQSREYFEMIRANENLLRPFPKMVTRADNPTTPRKIELGRLLYFDPILSGDNTTSCAHCHHPDLGFSDNRGLSMGKGGSGIGQERSGGKVLRRGSPTVWNAAYNHRQFWDGRARDLEHQASMPIQDPGEMAQDSTELKRELTEIPEYVQLFKKAFSDSKRAITFRNVTYAIATFERTLISNNSCFDRYAAGEVKALSSVERRWLNLFRSLKTRCFECHNLPTFANPDFKVIGVPDLPGTESDLGRGEVIGKGYDRAFKVPTLRNVALTAPYMHNGSFETLSEVIDFYAGGGGAGLGLDVSNIDDKIREFDITPREKEALIAFLHALSDESKKPVIPDDVPSGLPVVAALENQSPELAAFEPPPVPERSVTIHRRARRLLVSAGQRIQDAIDVATAGDTVLVGPGVYHEALTLDVSGITLLGLSENSRRPVLDGRGRLADALIGSGSDFEMRNFVIKNYTANGLMLNQAVDVTFREIMCENPGLYGIYPVECVGVTIEKCSVTGARDAGIYVGQSKDIIVRENRAFANVVGIEIENSVNAVVDNNEAFNNSGGILVFLLPNNPSKLSRNCKVINNRVYDNNHQNFGDPGAIVSKVPSGTGIMLLAADEVEVATNEITGNHSFAVAVIGLDLVFGAGTVYDVDPAPDNCWIHDNQIRGNGKAPAGIVEEMGFSGKELIWDASGSSNHWEQPKVSSMPPWLPRRDWPGIVKRGNKRLWQVLAAIGG